MKLKSTRNPALKVSWREAVLSGLSPDGGLFVPTTLPQCDAAARTALRGLPFQALAEELCALFMEDEIPREHIKALCKDTWNFDLPLRQVDEYTYVLELFHGPTCAFKDFGARFMAKLFRYFWDLTQRKVTVLVATSGDTGSAVANAFLDHEPDAPIKVAILYPRGKVTPIQRKQMTTLKHNVTAFEVDGTFDDCQALVKRALHDPHLSAHRAYTSANSINIARLLPQMFYYTFTTLQFPESTPLVCVVPSGNLGNLTGALLSHLCGFPVAHCIAACNSNSAFVDYLHSGVFAPSTTKETISNAMDVGAPSNFFRINSLLGENDESSTASPHSRLAKTLVGYSISDEDTRDAMRAFYRTHRYVLCPHSAVAAAALERYRTDHTRATIPAVLVATAHPAKFGSVVEHTLGISPEVPAQLQAVLDRDEQIIPLANNYEELISWIG
jgi:threonine synthase